MSRGIRAQLKHRAEKAQRDASFRAGQALAERNIANRRVKDAWAKQAQRDADAARSRYERGK